MPCHFKRAQMVASHSHTHTHTHPPSHTHTHTHTHTRTHTQRYRERERETKKPFVEMCTKTPFSGAQVMWVMKNNPATQPCRPCQRQKTRRHNPCSCLAA